MQQEGKVFDVLMGDGDRPKRKSNRPKIISILCVVLFLLSGLQIMGGIGIYMASQGLDLEKIVGVRMVAGEETEGGPVSLLSEEERQQLAEEKASTQKAELPAMELAVYGFVMYFLLFISVFGLWKMKRWGVFMFLALMVANIAVLFIVKPAWLGSTQGTPWFSLLLPALYLAVVVPYWKRIGDEGAVEGS